MTPMDKAWLFLKMPIVSDSPKVKQVHDGKPAHIHQFQDPVTGEVKPLYITPASNPDSETLYGGILGEGGDEHANAKFVTGYGNYESEGSQTDEEFRRRGYMSAIYDAMDEYLREHKKSRFLEPSPSLSDDGLAFWASRE